MLSKFKPKVMRLKRNEKGDIPVGTILVIGAIVIPLVIVLIAFGDEIKTFFQGQQQTIMSESTKLNN